MTSPSKLTIAAVVLLVCGVIVGLVGWRPAGRVTLKFQGFHTNEHGALKASFLVSNVNPHSVHFAMTTDDLSGPYVRSVHLTPDAIALVKGSRIQIPPGAVIPYEVAVPKERPYGIVGASFKDYASNWHGRLQVHPERARINYYGIYFTALQEDFSTTPPKSPLP